MTHALASLRRRSALGLMMGSALAPRAFGQNAAPAADTLALGRFHTDFVQAQAVPGRVLGENNSQPGVEGTPLSYNAKGDKAVTVVFRYPARWAMPKPHYVNSDQEFYILDGSVTFDDTTYGPGDYAYLPAGYQHKVMTSAAGCTMLNFYEGEHLAFYAETPAGMYISSKLIKKTETAKMAWAPLKDAASQSLGANPHGKLLRTDTATGESTWLVKVDADAKPAGLARAVATHAAVEEFFVLEGEVASPRGVMKTGAYVWRAPGQPRGPLGSKTGYTAIIRSKGGALNSILSETPAAVVWAANYAPHISDAARGFAMKGYDQTRKY
ncbi:MAG: cupin domain-containing protein [Rhodospirillaceae bacterium]|nr:cupin domain-containing protein [Rhodospirillaceae bacterium]